MSFLRRGGREREPGLSGPEPAGRKAPDFGVPKKVEDPYGAPVSYWIHDTRPLDVIRLEVEGQYKGDQVAVDHVWGRVTKGKEDRAIKDQR